MLQTFYRSVELLRQVEEGISRTQLMPTQLESHTRLRRRSWRRGWCCSRCRSWRRSRSHLTYTNNYPASDRQIIRVGPRVPESQAFYSSAKHLCQCEESIALTDLVPGHLEVPAVRRCWRREANNNPASYRQISWDCPRVQPLQAFHRRIKLLRKVEEGISRAQLMPTQLESHAAWLCCRIIAHYIKPLSGSRRIILYYHMSFRGLRKLIKL